MARYRVVVAETQSYEVYVEADSKEKQRKLHFTTMENLVKYSKPMQK